MQSSALTPEEFSDLIGLIYDSAFEDLQWQSLIDRMQVLFPDTTIGVIGYNGEETSIPYAVAGNSQTNYSLVEKQMQIELTEMIQKSPETLSLPLGYISYSKETFKGEFHKSSFYRNVIQPLGYDHYYSLKFIGSKDRYAMIAFGLKDSLQDQNETLYNLLKLLAPHFVRAAQLNRTLKLARTATEALSGFLDAIVLPMLVVNSSCDLLFSNSAGQRLLKRNSIFSLNPRGQLEMPDPSNTNTFRSQVQGMNRDVCPAGMRVPNQGTHVSLCMTPFKPSMIGASKMDRDMLDQEKMFAVFVGQHYQEAINAGLLQDIFQLTKREAEICSDLLSAKSVLEIARESGRSEKTIRNQVQTIYEKVDVNSNAELIDAMSVFRVVGSLFDGANTLDTNFKPNIPKLDTSH